MTTQQALSFALVGLTVIAFIWGRWRYDLIALGALALGVVIGVIPLKSAFEGFANDIVIIIASALVLSAAVARSGLVDTLMAPLVPRLKTEKSQVPVFAAVTALLSMLSKNVGALALMMPSALQIAKRTGVPASRLLMPMSFASLVGGLAVLVDRSSREHGGVPVKWLGDGVMVHHREPAGAVGDVDLVAEGQGVHSDFLCGGWRRSRSQTTDASSPPPPPGVLNGA